MTALLVAWIAVSVGYLAGLFQAHRAELKAAVDRLEAIEEHEQLHKDELNREYHLGVAHGRMLTELCQPESEWRGN